MCDLPQVIVGIISGVLPPVGLAILMMLLPIVLRLLAKFEGIPRKTGVELSLMTRYFIFQVVVSSFSVVRCAARGLEHRAARFPRHYTVQWYHQGPPRHR